jgi:ferredoxin--NADP+ reductase
MEKTPKFQIAIIGAGPAGLFAAGELASKGYRVVLFNRDIKPGGLAEYGIFPDKIKLKDGLRNQFTSILANENVFYLGNVELGKNSCIGTQTLFEWGFPVILVACGAQGIKNLNIPGEELAGVFHAKDLVYHYNRLPPFATRKFEFGKKVVIIGGGNVMTDIARYLIKCHQVKQITVIIRRGPAEVKFDKKELGAIISNLDKLDFESEFERVSGSMGAIGQDPVISKDQILSANEKACPKQGDASVRFRFLKSPRKLIPDRNSQKIMGIELEENQLSLNGEEVIATGTGVTLTMDCDTVIFAIGDRVTDDLGLPLEKNQVYTVKQPKFPIDGVSYEVGDPVTDKSIAGLFVAGWSRNPSKGLVGIARRDGVNAAGAIASYIDQLSEPGGISTVDLLGHLKIIGCQYVTKENLQILKSVEGEQALLLGVEEFKYSTNEEMLTAIRLSKTKE